MSEPINLQSTLIPFQCYCWSLYPGNFIFRNSSTVRGAEMVFKRFMENAKRAGSNFEQLKDKIHLQSQHYYLNVFFIFQLHIEEWLRLYLLHYPQDCEILEAWDRTKHTYAQFRWKVAAKGENTFFNFLDLLQRKFVEKKLLTKDSLNFLRHFCDILTLEHIGDLDCMSLIDSRARHQNKAILQKWKDIPQSLRRNLVRETRLVTPKQEQGLMSKEKLQEEIDNSEEIQRKHTARLEFFQINPQEAKDSCFYWEQPLDTFCQGYQSVLRLLEVNFHWVSNHVFENLKPYQDLEPYLGVEYRPFSTDQQKCLDCGYKDFQTFYQSVLQILKQLHCLHQKSAEELHQLKVELNRIRGTLINNFCATLEFHIKGLHERLALNDAAFVKFFEDSIPDTEMEQFDIQLMRAYEQRLQEFYQKVTENAKLLEAFIDPLFDTLARFIDSYLTSEIALQALKQVETLELIDPGYSHWVLQDLQKEEKPLFISTQQKKKQRKRKDKKKTPPIEEEDIMMVAAEENQQVQVVVKQPSKSSAIMRCSKDLLSLNQKLQTSLTKISFQGSRKDPKQNALRQVMCYLDDIRVCEETLLCKEKHLPIHRRLNTFHCVMNACSKALEQAYRYRECFEDVFNPQIHRSHNLRFLHQQFMKKQKTPAIVEELFLANHWQRNFYQQYLDWLSLTIGCNSRSQIPHILTQCVVLANKPESMEARELITFLRSLIQRTCHQVQRIVTIEETEQKDTDIELWDEEAAYEKLRNIAPMPITCFLSIISKLDEKTKGMPANYPGVSYVRQSKVALEMLCETLTTLQEEPDYRSFAVWISRAISLSHGACESLLHSLEYFKKGRVSYCHEIPDLARDLGIEIGIIGEHLKGLSLKSRYPSEVLQENQYGLGGHLIDICRTLRFYPGLEKKFQIVGTKVPCQLWIIPDHMPSMERLVEDFQAMLVEIAKSIETCLLPEVEKNL